MVLNPANDDGKLPVTVLSGFLGAGKTTLLKHILHTKHSETNPFRCAVIVNDMAELNIDQSLVEQNSIVQSDEVVAMQNGCLCCSLQNDLLEQITKLAASKNFDYMIIEGSGVAEPAQIAKLFADCKDDHDHENAHTDTPMLGQVARLDTCVTVVDVSSMVEDKPLWLGPSQENLSQLLAEQIEYSNVVLLNKTDLVDEAQLQGIQDRVSLLNPEAKLIPCRNSQIPVMEVVDTRLYNPNTFDEQWTRLKGIVNDENQVEQQEDAQEDCCAAKKANGQDPCCDTITIQPRTLKSGVSKVVLPVESETRPSSYHGITSFVYRARRPFHPERFGRGFLHKFFVYYDPYDDDSEEQGDQAPGIANGDRTEHDDAVKQDEGESPKPKRSIEELQKMAYDRQRTRTKELGQLIRAKGFLWLADTHDLMTTFSHAGNLVTMAPGGVWTALELKAYRGTKEEKSKLCKDWVAPWGDRRQELVFIGQNLNHESIQALLDKCLLSDDEFAMGVDYWKATMGDVVLDIGTEESTKS